MSKSVRKHSLARRTGIEVLGWTLVVLGLAALVLPGPGLLLLMAGLAVLSQQYEWAERRLKPVKVRALHGAALGVKTWPRISIGCVAGLFTIALGVVWWLQLPVPSWWPIADHWWLPGGRATGVSLTVSGLIALGLIIYSFRRFHGVPLPDAPGEARTPPQTDPMAASGTPTESGVAAGAGTPADSGRASGNLGQDGR